MSEREILELHNMELDGIQEEEDSIHMKTKTIMLRPVMINSQLLLMLARETLEHLNMEQDFIQEEEDSTHMKTKMIILK